MKQPVTFSEWQMGYVCTACAVQQSTYPGIMSALLEIITYFFTLMPLHFVMDHRQVRSLFIGYGRLSLTPLILLRRNHDVI